MVARARRAGPPADRVPRRPVVAVRRPRAAGGLPAGARGGRASRTTSGWSCGRRSTPAAGRSGVDVAARPAVAFTAICCANDLLALGALQRLAELGIDVPGDVSVAGFDDISTAALTAPTPVDGPAAAARARPARASRTPMPSCAGDDAVPQRLPTTVILRDSTAAPASTVPAPATAVPAVPDRGPAPRASAVARRLMAGTGTGALAGRVVLVTGSSRGIGAEVAVKAAAEGARVAVHYHRVAGRRRADGRARPRARGGGRGVPRGRSRRGRGRGARRPRHRAVRAGRRPREQRRPDAGRAVPRDDRGGLGRRPADRPVRRVPHLPRGAARRCSNGATARS